MSSLPHVTVTRNVHVQSNVISFPDSIKTEHLWGRDDPTISIPGRPAEASQLQQEVQWGPKRILLLQPRKPLPFRRGQRRTSQEMWNHSLTSKWKKQSHGIAMKRNTLWCLPLCCSGWKEKHLCSNLAELITKPTLPRHQRSFLSFGPWWSLWRVRFNPVIFTIAELFIVAI